jgi:hypothetical protein
LFFYNEIVHIKQAKAAVQQSQVVAQEAQYLAHALQQAQVYTNL